MSRIKDWLFHPRKLWEKNLFVLWFGTFMTGAALSLVTPFLPLYIDTLGHFSQREVTFWSGLVFSVTFLVTMIVSPFWGRLADLKGRKLMLLRASLGMGLTLGAMGFVTNVGQLIFLRALMGVFGGFISNANALMATSTPKEVAGRVLGTLATGGVTGGLLGPMIGGVIASTFGYRESFYITGIIFMVVFSLVFFFVHEDFKPIPASKIEKASVMFAGLKQKKLIFGMFITTMIIQLCTNSINPILSLYVRSLMHHHGNVELYSGVIASLPGVATLIAASFFGRLGDRVGTEKILTIGLITAVLVYIPMAFVSNIWQLGFLRFFAGIADACLLPSVQALLTRFTPRQSTGRIFSYNQSFQASGNVFGPLLGSGISGFFGYPAVFLASSFFALVNLVLVRRNTQEIRQDSITK